MTQPSQHSSTTSPFRKLLISRGDDMDFFKAMFLAIAVTAFFYEIFPLPFIDQGRILTLFDNTISEIITAMTLWSLFLLFFKYQALRLQTAANQAFKDPRILNILEEGVYVRNAEELLGRMEEVLRTMRVKRFETSAIYHRVVQIFHYIRSIPKKESIHNFLDHQSQIDTKKLDSGYALLQVFIWAIPILGFIGTVLGIGEAVNNFSIFIQTAEGGAQFSSQMRNALGGVTSGLSVAFNTTFLALLLVIPVMVITSIINKREEEILLAVEEFCMEELLAHLRITPSNDAVTENFDEHMHRILQLSNTWLAQLEPLVTKLSEQSQMVSHQIGGVQPIIKSFTDKLLPQAAPGLVEKTAPKAIPAKKAPRAVAKTTALKATTAKTTKPASKPAKRAAGVTSAKSAKPAKKAASAKSVKPAKASPKSR